MTRSALATVTAFIKLGRLKFVGGSLVMYGLGISVALFEGYHLKMPVVWLGLLFIISSQLMTHYCNDYFDYEADCANTTPTSWSGGSRILPSGAISLRAAFIAAVVLGIIAILTAAFLYLYHIPTTTFLVITATILFISWFYSAPPFRMHSTGFGELAAALVVGGLWPVLAYYLQTQNISLLILLAVIPVFILQFLMLVAIEFPDEAGDAQTGKKTFLVRVSATGTATVSAIILLAYLATVPILIYSGLPVLAGLGIAILFPVVIWQIIVFVRKDWKHPESWGNLAFRSVFLFAATGIAEALAFCYLWLKT